MVADPLGPYLVFDHVCVYLVIAPHMSQQDAHLPNFHTVDHWAQGFAFLECLLWLVVGLCIMTTVVRVEAKLAVGYEITQVTRPRFLRFMVRLMSEQTRLGVRDIPALITLVLPRMVVEMKL